MSPTNPYKPPGGDGNEPAGTTPYVSHRDARIADLERRVEALEQRIAHTRLVSHSFFARAFAVFGHWLAAYSVFAAIGLIIYAVLIGLAIWALRDAFS